MICKRKIFTKIEFSFKEYRFNAIVMFIEKGLRKLWYNGTTWQYDKVTYKECGFCKDYCMVVLILYL